MPKFKVEVFGQVYSITTDADPKYVATLAKYLDEKMKQIASKTKNLVSTNKITVLAAIHIANDLFSLKKEIKEQELMLDEKTEQILSSLDVMEVVQEESERKNSSVEEQSGFSS